MWLVEVLRRSAKMALALGRKDDASSAAQAADALRAAINNNLWDEGKQAYPDCIHSDGVASSVFSQHTQTVAYLCDIVPAEKRELFERYLTDVPEGWVSVKSPFMMAFSMEALNKAGNVHGVLKLIDQWWGMMIRNDATACWETFDRNWEGRYPTRSYCHAWSAAPAFALPAYVLGVSPIEPGFAKFALRPCLDELEFANGIVPTPRGDIQISLSKERERRPGKIYRAERDKGGAGRRGIRARNPRDSSG